MHLFSLFFNISLWILVGVFLGNMLWKKSFTRFNSGKVQSSSMGVLGALSGGFIAITLFGVGTIGINFLNLICATIFVLLYLLPVHAMYRIGILLFTKTTLFLEYLQQKLIAFQFNRQNNNR